MKLAAWTSRTCLLFMAVGLGFVLVAFWRPGSFFGSEAPSGGARLPHREAMEKAKKIMEKARPGVKAEPPPAATDGHRVFVSRTLIFLPEEEESVRPLDPQMKTADKIPVGWKLAHRMDPGDPGVASRDDDSDGFSNLEEFEKQTDPTNPESSPSRWVKLRLGSHQPAPLGMNFSGKTGNQYTLRFSLAGKRRDVEVVPGDSLWISSSDRGLEIGKTEAEAQRASGSTNQLPAIPLKIREYRLDAGQREDPATKTTIDYDDSVLVVERMDGLQTIVELRLDERGKPRGVIWDIGETRLWSLVPGEGEMGPFRLGQKFSYAGKTFLLKEVSPTKAVLRMEPEGETVELLPKTP